MRSTSSDFARESFQTAAARNLLWQPEREFEATWQRIQPRYLERDFVKNYLHKAPPFGTLGLIVYLRTYSRFLHDLGRRERWWETVLRVVEYSLSLHQGQAYSHEQLVQEAKELFDLMFHLKVFPAGRTLWIGGSPSTDIDGTANFNCSFRAINDLDCFSEIFYLLLVGAGTGFSIETKNICQLPCFDESIVLENKPYFPLSKGDRQDETSWFQNEDELTVLIGDSREGWVKALHLFFHASSPERRHVYKLDNLSKIRLIYDSVRPAGTPLKKTGGQASGPDPLKKMFASIHNIIKRDQGRLSSVGALDICNFIAEAVVVGGVRRSSQIALGDAGDESFKKAKYGLWTDPSLEPYRASRVMSNNSIMLYQRPTLSFLRETMHMIKDNGEPGFINCEEAQARRPNFAGVNPCAEILLDSRGVCNLTEVNMKSFAKGPGVFDIDGFLRAVRLATRLGSRMTNLSMWHEAWDSTQKRDRLLGVSLTGQQDAWDALGVKFFENGPISILKQAREVALAEAQKYHRQMEIAPPLLVTTVKPSGTISQLPGTSSGIHRSYAPEYLRRIRISKADPLAKALRSLGAHCRPENAQGDSIDDDRCNTVVFTFPVRTQAKMRAIDESALEQLERYKLAMEHYVDHNCSVTVSVAEDEWDDVAKWLTKEENWNNYVGVSFLPKFDEITSPFPQMPYQVASSDVIQNLERRYQSFSEEDILNALQQHEQKFKEYEVVDSDCATSGHCPVR
jgi:ribonucleoside-diphosphate reductase alpha chain/ribonucleoside-triphosphate reductase